MIDREKVVKGLTACTKPGIRGCFYDIKECPYDNNGCRMALMRDALTMLKEQEDTINELQSAYGYLQKQFLEAQDKLLKEPEIVLCKDCKNACIYSDDWVICTHIDSNGNDKHPADWFCADGQPR